MNWVQALPRVLDRIHDTVGEGGLSPYQIVFGCDRSLGNMSLPRQRECEDATQFFERMRAIDLRVADVLNRKHKELAAKRSQGGKLPPLVIGSKVWYKRPPNSGVKTDSRWIGPGIVLGREGAESYIIEIAPGHKVCAPRHWLKPYIFEGQGAALPLFYHRRTEIEEEVTHRNRRWKK